MDRLDALHPRKEVRPTQSHRWTDDLQIACLTMLRSGPDCMTAISVSVDLSQETEAGVDFVVWVRRIAEEYRLTGTAQLDGDRLTARFTHRADQASGRCE